MPEQVTIGNTPKILPYFEGNYRSTLAAFFAVWFYKELYVSLAKKIELSLQRAELDEGETGPSQAAIAGIIRVVEGALKTKIALFEPETSVFHGEAIVTWRRRRREVSLLSRGNDDDPKLLQYEAGEDQPSHHQIYPNATAQKLERAIAWLYE